MNKTLHILRLFWSTALAAEMEYRLNFVLTVITCLGQSAGSVFTIGLFYRGDRTLGGYSYEQSLIVVGLFIMLDGFTACVMRPNLARIINQVRDGTLDFVLLKPIDSQFWLSLRNCSPWGLPNLIAGMGIIGYAGAKLGFTPATYLLGIAPLAMGVAMLYSLWFMLGSLSVWFVKIPNITHVLTQQLEAGRFPITAYPVNPMIYRVVFTFVVPVAFLTTFPTDAMTGVHRMGDSLGMSGRGLGALSFTIAAGMLLASRSFWKYCLRYYTSASS